MTGRKFMFHDASGVRGPYTAEPIEAGNETWWALRREDSDRLAYASARSLSQGLRPGLHGPVGWVPVS